MSDGVEFMPEAACDECSAFGAYAFDGKTLCLSCYESKGSCCPEFEGQIKETTFEEPERKGRGSFPD